MIFIGNVDSFAVKLSCTEEIDGKKYGRFCFIINHNEVGDFDYGVNLGTAYVYFCNLLFNEGHREKPEFFKIEAGELFKKLDSWLYGPEFYELAEEYAQEYGGLQVLCGICESMDEWKGYLIENSTCARFLVAKLKSSVSEYFLSKGEFDSVIKATVDYMENNMGFGVKR